MRVVVTGADGFMGRAVCAWFERGGHEVFRFGRRYGDLACFDHWPDLLRAGDTIVHLAARAHVMHETAAAPLEEFRRVNVLGVSRLAAAAVHTGAKRFLLVSSIGVNGSTTVGKAFTEQDAPHPDGPYALSKLEAEQALLQVAAGTKMEWVIVRPPLVYGPHPKGNLRRLVRLVESGLPLPVRSLRQPRSFVGLDNLCSFLCTCTEHSRAANNLFVIADGEDMSVAVLVAKIAAAMERRLISVPMPRAVLVALAALAGRRTDVEKLTAPLQVEAAKARELLGWKPPLSVDAGIASMVAASESGSV